ncbi:MAG: hypothetical protein HQM06_01790 [Magnetococcales bacterium]|nr:hypothetical protein [Magnetococcales bacterium]
MKRAARGCYREYGQEGFLSLVRESEALSGRKPSFEVIGQGVKLTIFAGAPHTDY